MDNRLTRNCIGFCSPLLSKSDPLRVIADRTVSLFLSIRHVRLVERVAILAMSLSFIDRTKRIGIVQRILRRRHKAKMTDSNTVPVLTEMIDDEPRRDTSMIGEICDTMSTASLLAEIKGAITISVQSVLPQTTFTFLFPAIIKPISFLFGQVFHAVDTTPSYSR